MWVQHRAVFFGHLLTHVHTQILASANTSMSIPWPQMFSEFLNLLKVALLDLLTLTRTGCATPMSFYANLMVTLFAFAGGSILGFAVLVAVDMRHRHQAAVLRRTLQAVVNANTILPRMKRSRGQRGKLANSLAHSGAGSGATSQPVRQPRRQSVVQSSLEVASELPSSLRSMRWGRVFKALGVFWTLCYPGISVKLCRVFQCVYVSGEWYLKSDMSLQCFSAQWGFVAVLSAIMLGVYTFGLPLGMALWLWKNRFVLDKPETIDNLGFLYLYYGTRAYMWGVAELLRKLVLTSLILLFFDSGSALQVTFALVVSAFAHVAHSLWRPYTDRAAYMLQHGSLAVTTLVYATGLLFKVRGLTSTQARGAGASTTAGDSSADVFSGLGLLLVLMCAAFLLWALALVVVRIWPHVRVQVCPGSRPSAIARARLRGKTASKLSSAQSGGARGSVVALRSARSSRRRAGVLGVAGGTDQHGSRLPPLQEAVPDGVPSVNDSVWQSNPLAHRSRVGAPVAHTSRKELPRLDMYKRPVRGRRRGGAPPRSDARSHATQHPPGEASGPQSSATESRGGNAHAPES